MVSDDLKRLIENALKSVPVEVRLEAVHLEHPADMSHGDYSTNVALSAERGSGKNPKDLAEELLRYIVRNKPSWLDKVEVAGAGFINFYLSKDYFSSVISDVVKQGDLWGSNETLKSKKVMVEYTDPNPFKELHIGHLMSNSIGESISRFMEFSGAETKRANYQGDVGLHVAKAVWGIKRSPEALESSEGLGSAYALGARAYDEDESAKSEIEEINGHLYARDDIELNELYKKGKDLSLAHFELIYKKLGTKFDYVFFESEVGESGTKIVEENMNVFEESDGAIVFRGEKKGLHTRVFITSKGLPVYEAKELALTKAKYDKYPFDVSIVVTANEINEYFKVVLEAMRQIFPELAEKTIHMGHGKLRLASGKMSSRTGNIIAGMWLVDEVEKQVLARMNNGESQESSRTAQMIAVGAVKYSMLKQSASKDIIFDFEKSLSVEGDSGPYLQYAYVRAKSLIAKAGIPPELGVQLPILGGWETTKLERILYRFPEVVKRSAEEYEPHYLVTYLTTLASLFNGYYAREKILGSKDESYKLDIVRAFQTTIQNGLWLLGIETPERM
jgi:arginyl-tRNA synthetase